MKFVGGRLRALGLRLSAYERGRFDWLHGGMWSAGGSLDWSKNNFMKGEEASVFEVLPIPLSLVISLFREMLGNFGKREDIPTTKSKFLDTWTERA